MKTPYQLKTRRMLLSVCMLALALTLGLTACAQEAETTQPQSQEQSSGQQASSQESAATVTLSVDTTALEEGSVQVFGLDFASGDTPLSLLEKSDVDFLSEDSSYGAYVTSIDGVTQGEHGAMSGWVYEVNDESIMESADAYEVKEGDRVVWKFTTGEEFAQ